MNAAAFDLVSTKELEEARAELEFLRSEVGILRRKLESRDDEVLRLMQAESRIRLEKEQEISFWMKSASKWRDQFCKAVGIPVEDSHHG